jgi:3-dehydroquinate synthetase
MLKTLPEDEFLSGLAEMIKAGAILDGSLLEDISAQRSSILNRDEKILAPLIERSVKLKASVVAEDEREAGNRMILNFGHTFGHVIESSTSMKHGYAIASGMAISAGISVSEGILEKKEAGRLKKILGDFGLLTKFNIPEDVLLKKISGDKKKKGNDISFVLIGPVGKATIAKIPVKKLIEYYKSHSGSL